MRVPAVIVLLFAPLAVASAQAELRWLDIATADGVRWSLDLASGHQQGANVFQVWIRSTRVRPPRASSSRSVETTRIVSRFELDCGERRLRISDVIRYGSNNLALGAMPHTEAMPWEYPPPESMGERLLEVCSMPELLDGSKYRAVSAEEERAKATFRERVARCEAAPAEPVASQCRRWRAVVAHGGGPNAASFSALVDSLDTALRIRVTSPR